MYCISVCVCVFCFFFFLVGGRRNVDGRRWDMRQKTANLRKMNHIIFVRRKWPEGAIKEKMLTK